MKRTEAETSTKLACPKKDKTMIAAARAATYAMKRDVALTTAPAKTADRTAITTGNRAAMPDNQESHREGENSICPVEESDMTEQFKCSSSIAATEGVIAKRVH
jgi:hypothetical protein